MAMFRSAIITLLAVAVSADPKKCIGPHETVEISHGGKKVEVGADYIKSYLLSSLGKGTIAALKKHPKVKAEIEGKTDCQYECVGHVVETSLVPTVWGTGMIKLPQEQQKEFYVQMLTGAIKTCYPGIPRKTVLAIAKEIDDSLGMITKKMPEMKLNFKNKCQGPPGAKDAALAKFKKFAGALGPAAQSVLQSKKFERLAQYVSSGSFACQSTCAFGHGGTLGQSLLTWWKSGLIAAGNARELIIFSITGALKTCYPSVPHGYVAGFVSAVMDQVDEQLKDVVRLYPEVGIPHIAAQNAAAANQIPLLNIVIFAAATFGVGMMAGLAVRRMKRPQSDETREMLSMELE